MAEENGRGIVAELADYLFYAPVGLVVSVADEIPGFVAKGRSRLEGRIGTARTIGEFAVAMGRRRVEQAIAERARPAKQPPPAPAGEVATALAGARGAHEPTPAPSSAAPGTRRGTRGNRTEDWDAAGGTPGREDPIGDGRPGGSPVVGIVREPSHAAGTGAPAAVNGRAAPSELAIPGYDALAASQVVQRLAGLSNDELDEVRRYEEATRGRRTILGRISQLTTTRGVPETE